MKKMELSDNDVSGSLMVMRIEVRDVVPIIPNLNILLGPCVKRNGTNGTTSPFSSMGRETFMRNVH